MAHSLIAIRPLIGLGRRRPAPGPHALASGEPRQAVCPHTLRRQLLGDMHNPILRRLYLATRTHQLAQRDHRQAILRHFGVYVLGGAAFAAAVFGLVFGGAAAAKGGDIGNTLYSAVLLAVALAPFTTLLALRDLGQALSLGTLGPLPLRACLTMDARGALAAFLGTGGAPHAASHRTTPRHPIPTLLDELLPHAPGKGWYRAPMIPPRKLANAIARYAPRLRRDEVLALTDGTAFGSAALGCLLTGDRLYFHTSAGSGSVALRDVRQAHVRRGLRLELVLRDGRSACIYCEFFEKIRPGLQQFLLRLPSLLDHKPIWAR